MIPVYYAKIITLAGTVIAAPLLSGAIEFSSTCFEHSQNRQLGQVTIPLIPPVGADVHLHDIYDLLDYRQRIEIYDRADCLGDPIWTGVITELPSDLGGQDEIRGVGVTQLLADRKLRRYHRLNGNVATLAQDLLKTYQVVFKDTFQNLDDWTTTLWTYVLGTANIAHVGSNGTNLTSNTVFTHAQWSDARISFDFQQSAQAQIRINLGWNGLLNPNWNDYDDVEIYTIGGLWRVVVFENGSYNMALGTRDIIPNVSANHVDIYTSISDGNRRVIVVLNGVEMIDVTDTRGTASGDHALIFDQLYGATGSSITLDNVVFAANAPALTAGAFDTTVDTIDQTFNGDRQLDALEWICNHQDWEYIIHPKAGAGNDVLDCGASVGLDLSSVLILEEGKNISGLQKSRTSDELATSLYVQGQSSDDATTNFIANGLDAFDDYGIIDGDYADPRVTDITIAHTLGNYELSRRSAGNVSLSGVIEDETWLLEQEPRWGSAIWGDFVWGGRKQLAAGDYVWLKSKRLNEDRKVRIVQLTRRSGSAAVSVTFDYHAWRRSQELPRLRREVALLQRQLMKRMDTQPLQFNLTGTTPYTLPLNILGTYHSVYIDVDSAAWAGAVTFAINGINRTSALFGASTITAKVHADDTSYLVLSGDYTITLTPTQTVTVVVTIRPNLLG